MTNRISKYMMVTMVLILGGCASAPAPAPEHEPTVETLEQRAQGRWDAVIAGDFQAAYRYFTPGVRATVSYEAYLRKNFARTVKWTGGKFKEVVECDGNACKVRTVIYYQVKSMVAGTGPFKSSRAVIEDWIRIDGQWYFIPLDIL